MKKSFFFVCMLLLCIVFNAKSQEYIPDAIAVTSEPLKSELWRFVDSLGTMPPGLDVKIVLRPVVSVEFGDGFKLLDPELDLLSSYQKNAFYAVLEQIKKPGSWLRFARK
jgi:hypothetical protein